MAKKKNAIVSYEDRMAEEAKVAAAMEAGVATGSFFSLKSGQLSFNDSPIEGNEMAVVILSSRLENIHYEGEYDPDDIQGPTCFAFGKDDSEMAPHEVVQEAGTAVHDNCEECPNNEWGSADTGRGKACRNTRRLAMIPAGKFDKSGEFVLEEDPGKYADAEVAYMKLPVTSVKGYAAFVKNLSATLERPPHCVITRVAVVPDTKTQFKVVFEALEEAPKELLEVLFDRHDEVENLIEFPYTVNTEKESKEDKKKKGATRRKTKKY